MLYILFTVFVSPRRVLVHNTNTNLYYCVVLYLHIVVWAPLRKRHLQFPPEFRRAVLTILLANNRFQTQCYYPTHTTNNTYYTPNTTNTVTTHTTTNTTNTTYTTNNTTLNTTSMTLTNTTHSPQYCLVNHTHSCRCYSGSGMCGSGSVSLPHQIWLLIFTFANRYVLYTVYCILCFDITVYACLQLLCTFSVFSFFLYTIKHHAYTSQPHTLLTHTQMLTFSALHYPYTTQRVVRTTSLGGTGAQCGVGRGAQTTTRGGGAPEESRGGTARGRAPA